MSSDETDSTSTDEQPLGDAPIEHPGDEGEDAGTSVDDIADTSGDDTGVSKPKHSIGRDIGAGITTGIANVPDAMANAVLAGLNPVSGLYALLVGTPSAALTTSSQFLTVAVTAAMALAVGDALKPFGSDADQLAAALVTLTVLTGIVMIVLGLLKAGSLMRFVSNSVMRGFLTGVALTIILGQIPKFVGSTSAYENKLAAAVDVTLNPTRFDWTTVFIGLFTMGVVLALEFTPAKRFSMVIALVLATAGTALLGLATVLVADVSPIPQGFPTPVLPDLGMVFGLLVPAFSVALIGLIQGAGVSKSTPNSDGSYPSLSGDFVGQGIGNAVSGLFRGMPIGGSVSSTALNLQGGATSRWSNFVVGPTIGVILIALFWAVELIPMTSLAALLIIVGFRAIDREAITTVWLTGLEPRVIMVITFVAVLLMPIQYAVLLGVALSIVTHIYSSSLDVRVAELMRLDDGRIAEASPSETLKPNAVTILQIYGSVFYAGAQVAEGMLPDPLGAGEAIVILRLRGRADVGSTFLDVIDRYRVRLEDEGGTLMLAGVGPALYEQLERTGELDNIGEDNIFKATRIVTDSTDSAIVEAERRLAE
jgi:SulP family sulfate permease